MSAKREFECVIVGGGAAGLSAALVLGRARRRVLVVDAGEQSNLAAPKVGGLFSYDGASPNALYQRGREQLEPYPTIELRRGAVTAARSLDAGFALEIDQSDALHAARLLLAMGMHYHLPDVPGAAKLWGDTVFHCPFCHGWELRDRPLAVLGNGDEGAYRALLLRGWSDDVVLLTDGRAELDLAAEERLATARIAVIERPSPGSPTAPATALAANTSKASCFKTAASSRAKDCSSPHLPPSARQSPWTSA